MSRQMHVGQTSSGYRVDDLSSRSNFPNYYSDKQSNAALIDLIKNMVVEIDYFDEGKKDQGINKQTEKRN